METFLEPFVAQAQKIYENGVNWTLDDGSFVHSKFAPMTVSADSVQRPQLQNHLQLNAHFGCCWCFHPGLVLPGTTTVLYPYLNAIIERTEEQTLNDMKEAALLPIDKNGVNGISPLIFLPGFNHVWGYGADLLHPVALGVFKDIIGHLFEETCAVYCLTRKRTFKNINARLTGIKPPSIVSHVPISLRDLGVWKGADYGPMLLWYILPLLHDVWDNNQYLVHIACHAEAITLLSKKSISEEDFENADELLHRFVKKTLQICLGIVP